MTGASAYNRVAWCFLTKAAWDRAHEGGVRHDGGRRNLRTAATTASPMPMLSQISAGFIPFSDDTVTVPSGELAGGAVARSRTQR